MKSDLSHTRNGAAGVEITNLNGSYEKNNKEIPGHDERFAFAPGRMIEQSAKPIRRMKEPRVRMTKGAQKDCAEMSRVMARSCNLFLFLSPKTAAKSQNY